MKHFLPLLTLSITLLLANSIRPVYASVRSELHSPILWEVIIDNSYLNKEDLLNPIAESSPHFQGAVRRFGDIEGVQITGTITDPEGSPIPGVNIVEKGTSNGVITDMEGNYRITVSSENAILILSFIGYKTVEVPIARQTTIDLVMEEDLQQLNAVEIYSTGYQQLPPERATGSFAFVDQELIKRSTSTDIISRLESVTPGLLFDKRGAGDDTGMDQRNLRIRGVNSIESDNSPLIVVDNFPYEGNINNINPNDVESITVLRDAAAASIWGARAANGVIVITLKQGKKNQPLTISFSSNVTVGDRPDLNYSPEFIPSQEFIGLEKELFSRGFYNSDENSSSKPALSPVVELLIKERDGQITSEELDEALTQLGQYDVRDQAEKYFYRKSFLQQHAFNIRGGGDKTQHYVSAGYDKNMTNVEGNDLQRITLVSNNTYSPSESFQISLGINISNQQQNNNGLRWGSPGTELPYNRFADQNGNWLPVVNTLRTTYTEEMTENGLLDWQYRPLQEISLTNSKTKSTSQRVDAGLSYRMIDNLKLEAKYQYQQTSSHARSLQDQDSYYIRDRVNRFTQADGSRIFPLGDILTERFDQQLSHSGRIQLNYDQTINRHSIQGLAGAEIRQVHASGNGLQLFGYDDKVLTFNSQLDYTTRYPVYPRGTSYLPRPANTINDLTDRYLSYFGNASYTFNLRYRLSASARYDASNLFGVKTNQKGIPLWSTGISWDLSDEPFYDVSVLPYLRLRATYGYNGNINKSVTAYPTAAYSTDWYTNLPILYLRTPGNPQLRWEKVAITNFGVDFEFKNQRLSGTIEYFKKHGKDIIGEVPLDPTTGAMLGSNLSNKVNYAETMTRGMDVQLKSINIDQDFQWNTNVIFSFASNKILNYYDESTTYSMIRAGTAQNRSMLPQQGKSIDGLYSVPWWGLDPETGDPLVEMNGELVKEYREYTQNLTFKDLIYHGVNVAPLYGAVRNNMSWKEWALSVNISWKANYYFRKSGLNYDNLFDDQAMHRDFLDRWQQPGDEAHTNVPSMPEQANAYRDFVYTGSELMIEKGDHIRLEDINIGYTFSQNASPWLPLKELRVFAYARNLGILWQASKSGLDPDYPNASYRTPRTYSIGLNATF
ncbi:TonB-dependent receptor [Marinoscillum pacificum]|uniref:TonB-dependent receptor n=1 Tax=Marinoscillum pacificum TaxID=392723 RepID=UPI002157D89A|nr:TonB-dependent receptor [Marinoscillum pacificum]